VVNIVAVGFLLPSWRHM